MQEISHIIVPVDFTPHTDKLVEFAMYVADKFSAKVTFFHVSETYGGYGGFVHTSLAEAEQELQAYSERKMKTLVENNTSKCRACSGKVVIGEPVDEIIAFAEKEQADLIFIGTHGSKGLEKILLGSVAERVVKNSPCLTLTYNPYK